MTQTATHKTRFLALSSRTVERSMAFFAAVIACSPNIIWWRIKIPGTTLMIEQKHIPKVSHGDSTVPFSISHFRTKISTHKQLTEDSIVARINHPWFCCFTRYHFLWVFNRLYSFLFFFFFFFNCNSLYKTIHCFKNTKKWKNTTEILKLILDKKESVIWTLVVLKLLEQSGCLSTTAL